MHSPIRDSVFPLLFAFVALTLAATAHAAHHSGMGRIPGKVLGVAVSEIPSDALTASNLEHGVRVERIVPGSPAQDAGLKQGDIITELLDKPVYSVERLQWLVRQAPAGEPVALRLQRDGSAQTVPVEFRPPQATAKLPGPKRGGPGHSSAFLGVQLQTMTAQLRSAFGASEEAGVLVAALVKDGPAEKAGVAVGDVLSG